MDCTPPHDVPGKPFRPHLIKTENQEAAETTKLLNYLILRSQALLADHPVNMKRKEADKDVANSNLALVTRLQTTNANFKRTFWN